MNLRRARRECSVHPHPHPHPHMHMHAAVRSTQCRPPPAKPPTLVFCKGRGTQERGSCGTCARDHANVELAGRRCKPTTYSTFSMSSNWFPLPELAAMVVIESSCWEGFRAVALAYRAFSTVLTGACPVLDGTNEAQQRGYVQQTGWMGRTYHQLISWDHVPL